MKFEERKIYIVDRDFSKKLIANRLFVANTVFTRLRGLMFKKDFKKNHALILEPCKSIHMFFMRFPIDVIYLDKNYRVLRYRKGIKPWMVDIGHKDAYSVIELPSNTIEGEPYRLIIE